MTQTLLLLLSAEAWSRSLELSHCITAHVEPKIINNCYISLCRDSSNAHARPQCLKVRLEWWKMVSQGCVTLTKHKAFPAPLNCSSLSLFSRRIKWCGSTGLTPVFLCGISQITVHALVPSRTVVICLGTYNGCPRDLKSHLHSIPRQKDRWSLGKPECMGPLCPVC